MEIEIMDLMGKYIRCRNGSCIRKRNMELISMKR